MPVWQRKSWEFVVGGRGWSLSQKIDGIDMMSGRWHDQKPNLKRITCYEKHAPDAAMCHRPNPCGSRETDPASDAENIPAHQTFDDFVQPPRPTDSVLIYRSGITTQTLKLTKVKFRDAWPLRLPGRGIRTVDEIDHSRRWHAVENLSVAVE